MVKMKQPWVFLLLTLIMLGSRITFCEDDDIQYSAQNEAEKMITEMEIYETIVYHKINNIMDKLKLGKNNAASGCLKLRKVAIESLTEYAEEKCRELQFVYDRMVSVGEKITHCSDLVVSSIMDLQDWTMFRITDVIEEDILNCTAAHAAALNELRYILVKTKELNDEVRRCQVMYEEESASSCAKNLRKVIDMKRKLVPAQILDVFEDEYETVSEVRRDRIEDVMKKVSDEVDDKYQKIYKNFLKCAFG